jgi:hypothetical protein
VNTATKPAELKLINGPVTITIRPAKPGGADPIICKAWDLGAPEMRYTTVANPGTDGTSYSDGFVGARTVTLELAIMGGKSHDGDLAVHDAYWYASRLTAMTHPMASPVLQIVRDDEIAAGFVPDDTGDRPAYTMRLRGSPYNLPFTARSAALLEMQLVFTCPLGLIESPLREYKTIDITADDTTATDWVFPAKFDKRFGLINDRFPQMVIKVGGDTAVTPILYISGPCTNPEVLTDDEERFRFDGLTLDTGQTVQIDMGTGSVRLGTTTGTILDDMTVYNTVDWAVSTFWRWLPGDHKIYFLNTHGTLAVQFHERRLTI